MLVELKQVWTVHFVVKLYHTFKTHRTIHISLIVLFGELTAIDALQALPNLLLYRLYTSLSTLQEYDFTKTNSD